MKIIISSIVLCLLLSIPNSAHAQDKHTKRLIHKVEKKLMKWNNYFSKWNSLGRIQVDSVSVLRDKKEIRLYFNDVLSYIPLREKIIEKAKKSLKKKFGFWLRHYDIKLYSKGKQIQEYVPNIYRNLIPVDSSRFIGFCPKTNPIIEKKYAISPTKGLLNRNLAIWHSHGRYYEAKLDRWEWQRARLQSTVEDIFPMTFVLDYLEPMLENAGANIFVPRERDINPDEVIIDNDRSTGHSFIAIEKSKADTIDGGFFNKDTLFNNENPFMLGTYLKLKSGSVKYIPDIPRSAKYAVYISYGKNNTAIVDCKVSYSGGEKRYKLNQSQGYGTWIYLGKFFFEKGINKDKKYIEFSCQDEFTIDAIKLGGGMGNVARRPSSKIAPKTWSLKGVKHPFQKDNDDKIVNPNDFSWKLSGMPRYLEAARYYLQYSGMPDSIVYSLSNGKSDYNDDYKSRGEWVNYLMGAPNGPTGHNNIEGLGIPIDMALAFHTDAGVTKNDSIIGTLAIYNSDEPSTVFPYNQSKMVNRDLVDIIQTQIVNDIRALHNSKWTRRGIWNKPYSEAWRANTPMMLLELMSHQNLSDMKFGMDHKFKFDVSRAIYKGILKFLAYQNHFDYIVQPLPVDHFSMKLIEGKKIHLSWSPVTDSLEPTAIPIAYKVYKRIENQGFDQGILTKEPFINIEINSYNKIYSFKITAINEGGESFPSEILSVGLKENSNTALIVNAFDRVGSPAIFDDGNRAGFDYQSDMGVPYVHEIGLTGQPYEFDRSIPWLDDDNPGWGASFSNWEGKIIAGNTFDYPFVHGKAVLSAGHSFISTSDEAFCKENFEIKNYDFVDIIFGKERTITSEKRVDFSVFTPKMMHKIATLTENGKSILISGAYISTDFTENKFKKADDFAKEVLHYKWRTNFASKSGYFSNTDYVKNEFSGRWKFNTSLSEKVYVVEAPDGIEPTGKNAVTAFRYDDTGISAGVIYQGKYKSAVLGFPFETIVNSKDRNNLMKQIIMFFN